MSVGMTREVGMIRDATLVVIHQDAVILEVQVTHQDVVILEVQATLPEVVTHKVTHKDVGSQERHSHWYLQFKEEGVVGD